MIAALNRLHTCLAAHVLASVPPLPWLLEGMADRMRSLTSVSSPPRDDDPDIRAVYNAARHWLNRSRAGNDASRDDRTWHLRDGRVPAGGRTRRAYGSCWNRIMEQWGGHHF
jgi:hypothetical protein